MLAYIDKWRPGIFIFQIMKQITFAPKDPTEIGIYEFTQEYLNQRGYVLVLQSLTPTEFGCPHRCPRTHGVAYKVSHQAIDQQSECRWTHEHMQKLPAYASELVATTNALKLEPLQLGRFLLSFLEAEKVMNINERLLKKHEEPPTKKLKTLKEKTPEDYEVVHYEMFKDQGFEYPPCLDDFLGLAQGVA